MNTTEAAFKEAASLMQKGQYKDAIPFLERVQQDRPDNASVLWNLGILLRQKLAITARQ